MVGSWKFVLVTPDGQHVPVADLAQIRPARQRLELQYGEDADFRLIAVRDEGASVPNARRTIQAQGAA